MDKFNDDDGFELFVSQCACCRHWDAEEGTRCTAYPGGIPYWIRVNEISHREPQAGDRGIRFEQRKEP